MNYIVYYKTCSNLFHMYDGVDIKTTSTLPKNQSSFYLTKGYEASDDDLKRYFTDVLTASNELKKSKELRGFDYIKPYESENKTIYRTHQINIERVFKLKASKDWKTHQEINTTEATWFEQCYNAGLQYVELGNHECFGYDFSNFYARILGDERFSELQIPTKQGTEQILSHLPERVPFGFYRVKITCEDPNIKKVFSFSKSNVYCHSSITFIYELQRKTKFNITLELAQDGNPNAYIYNDEDMIKTSSIFGEWFDTVLTLKKKYPKNILVKMLSSSLWGFLSQKNSIFWKSSEIDKLDGSVCVTDDADFKIVDVIKQNDGNEYFELLKTAKPYKYNIRLKPFITSFGRNKTGRISLKMIDSVIRIHTDGIAFNRDYTTKTEHFTPEAKTTGHIQFNNINNYERL